MSLLGVIGFHFPEYLTTPELREIYAEHQLRTLLLAALVLASLASLLSLAWSSRKRIALLGLAASLLAWLAGGPNVPLDGSVRQSSFYISLDWVLLDLVLIATLFISMERFFRLKPDQAILRRAWHVDLAHYVANHLFLGVLVWLMYLPANSLQPLLPLDAVQAWVAGLPVWVQVPLLMLSVDFVQYWVHRAMHAWPPLWRFHRVHHSVEVMDWLAGSRLHVVDILLTRSLSLLPAVLLGFSNEAVNIYLPILALQSVFIHCNLNWALEGIQKVMTTPKFHHWHHTADPGCTDRNFSISLPLLDILFGTFYSPRGQWPVNYGLAGEKLRESYWNHLVSPFKFSGDR
jgi:sterol desaturase/sphingolipid hydroxylase (fatty acid hydroxylase superfamily)